MVHGFVDVYCTNKRFERDVVKYCALSSVLKQDVKPKKVPGIIDLFKH